jgi:hypothetical protein
LLDTCFRDGRLIGAKAPSFVDDFEEVGFTLGGEHCIQVGVVADKAFLIDSAVFGFCLHVVGEFFVHDIGVLFTGQDTGVVFCVVVFDHVLQADVRFALAEVLESVLHDCQAVV